MTTFGWLQIAVLLVVVGLLTKPLGAYMARVFQGQPVWIDRALGPVERFIYRISRASIAKRRWAGRGTPLQPARLQPGGLPASLSAPAHPGRVPLRAVRG